MKYTTLLLSASLCWSTTLFAQDFQFVGKMQQPINQQTQQVIKAQAMQAKDITLPRTVTVLKVQLSENAWTKLHDKVQDNAALMQAEAPGQNSVQLGMNNVPILDQGPHGTCVTFATSAAISALLNKGDYVSELCQLQLGLYLEKNGYMLSGWEGTFGSAVLDQMQFFGIVSKDTQQKQGCGGYKDYPVNTRDEPTNGLSLTDYHQLSESFPENIGWSAVLDFYEVFADKINPDTTLQQVKIALTSGDRLIFGVMLFHMDEGVAGAVGKYHAIDDTWVLTPEIIAAINSKDTEVGGHEMIITGFNDDATAVDAKGRVHKGLLTLRNSWGTAYGDKGTFYMSYDYFKALTLEVERIRKLY